MPVASEADEQKVLDDVRDYGWHAVGIEEDEEGPPFAYSIGLHPSFGHPEILVLGLKPETGFTILAQIARLIREGERFVPGTAYDGIIEAYPVRFCPVGREFYREYLGFGLWFYEGGEFPVLQCVVPDREGRFPWDDGCAAGLLRRQPVLSQAWIHLSQAGRG